MQGILFFGKKSYKAKKGALSSPYAFCRPKTFIKVKGVTFDQMKLFKKSQCRKNRKTFSQSLRKLISSNRIKKNRSHGAEKRKRGDPLDFLLSSLLQKIKITKKGPQVLLIKKQNCKNERSRKRTNLRCGIYSDCDCNIWGG